ncbi:hypothetical protein D9M69_733760 [compost metagenome]
MRAAVPAVQLASVLRNDLSQVCSVVRRAQCLKKASARVVSWGVDLYNQADFLPALGIITHVNNIIDVDMAIKHPDAARILKKAYKSVVRQTYDQIETWA